jgi:predicted enzyme related to lactoylglutathione lyase
LGILLRIAHRRNSIVATPFTAGAIVYAKDIQRLARFYAEVADLEVMHEVADHVVLESETHELVIVAIPAATAARIVIATPPVRRENTAFKLSFAVASLADARAAAKAAGGELNSPEKEWDFQGLRVCDGCDPEGNMIQVREVPPAVEED